MSQTLFEFDDDLIATPKDRFARINRSQDYKPVYKNLKDLEYAHGTTVKSKINTLNYFYLTKKYSKCLALCLEIIDSDIAAEDYDTKNKPSTYLKVSNGNSRTVLDSALRCVMKLNDRYTAIKLLDESIIHSKQDYGFWYTRILALNFLQRFEQTFNECIEFLKVRPSDLPVLKVLSSLPIDGGLKSLISKRYNIESKLVHNSPLFSVSQTDLDIIMRKEIPKVSTSKEL
eukprot:NODE_63_length_25098_cov_0.440498.p13 type:complete len:230 gc:universal NODE_63_length_25098_cov_0.440498:24485-23796(-)